MARLQIGDRVKGRIARVTAIHTQIRDGRPFVVYVLSDSLRSPEGRPTVERADWRRG